MDMIILSRVMYVQKRADVLSKFKSPSVSGPLNYNQEESRALGN